MKVIDLTLDQEKRPAGLLGQVSTSLKPGKPHSEDAVAQERMIASLQKSLGNQYVLLRQARLEGLEIPIPFILIGPPGVRVGVVSGLRGIFRAREDSWEKLDERQQKYRPASPNLLTRTLLMARSVQAFLANQGCPSTEIEPVLFFSDPGIHVEVVKSAVRLVMADAVDRFVAGLIQSRIHLNQEEIDHVVQLLAGKGNVEHTPQVDVDAFSYSDPVKPRQPSNLERAVAAGEQGFLTRITRLPFTSRQWMMIGVIIFISILLLAAFVLFLIFNT
jgi:hypothetical protein